MVLTFAAQLAGFIVGGVGSYFLIALAAWLVLGAPTGPDSGALLFAPMLIAGPVGFLGGGFVGMRLAGKWV